MEPKTAAEWARYWGHWKRMKVPGKSGGCVEIEVQYVLGRGRDLEGREFDAFVRWHDSGRNRDFHMLFVEEGEVVAVAQLPILCVPAGDVVRAWWVLPAPENQVEKKCPLFYVACCRLFDSRLY